MKTQSAIVKTQPKEQQEQNAQGENTGAKFAAYILALVLVLILYFVFRMGGRAKISLSETLRLLSGTEN